jgi:hypothetical protein
MQIESPGFPLQEDPIKKCSRPSFESELIRPIVKHDHPASIIQLPSQNVPSDSLKRSAAVNTHCDLTEIGASNLRPAIFVR